MRTALVAEGLEHSYGGKEVLRVGRLEVIEGEVTAVVGPNGAGKSTLLRLMALLEAPGRGEITFWDGSRLSAMSRRDKRRISRDIAVVFQDPLLLGRPVWQNLEYGLRVRGVPREERAKRVRAMLDRLGLRHLAGRHASTLSGGEARKVSIGRAMVLDPKLLLLDEPLSNLDLSSRREILRLISEMVREKGITAVYVSHDHHEVLEIADRMAVLLDGELVQEGRPDEVFHRPASERVAAFLGAENLLDGRVTGNTGDGVAVSVGRAEVYAAADFPVGERVKVMVHPEEVVLLPPGVGSGSARNRLVARVADLRELGGVARVRLDCGFPLTAHVTRTSCRELGLRPGATVLAAFKATSVHLMPYSSKKDEAAVDGTGWSGALRDGEGR